MLALSTRDLQHTEGGGGVLALSGTATRGGPDVSIVHQGPATHTQGGGGLALSTGPPGACNTEYRVLALSTRGQLNN